MPDPIPDLASRCLQLLVTRSLCRGRVADVVRAALAGGVDLLQVREKECTTRQRIELARPVLDVAAESGVPVLMNDDVEAALRLGLAGVHLGQEDAPVEEARRRLGPVWIGLSTHGPLEVERAQRLDVTHLGLGACFATATRPSSRVLPAGELEAALAAAHLPVFAIGGIGPGNVAGLVARGVRRIAVSSAILAAPDPASVARALREALPPP